MWKEREMLVPSFQLFSMMLVLLLLSATSTAQKAGNCSSSCGKLQGIPYPFGVGDGCSYTANKANRIKLDCINSTPFLGPYEVTNISLSQSYGFPSITVKVPIFWECYGRSSPPISLPFPLSPSSNQFVAIGCNTFASFNPNENDTSGTSMWCRSKCTALEEVEDGTCSGVGCCYNEYIPNHTSEYNFEFASSRGGHISNCSYAFMVETGYFNFRRSMLDSRSFKDEKMPVVLEWYLLSSCNASRDSFPCPGPNTGVNYWSDSVVRSSPGCIRYEYICTCRYGYEGNPYVPDGCQDRCRRGAHKCLIGSTCIHAGYHGYSCIYSVRAQVAFGIGGGTLVFFLLVGTLLWCRRMKRQQTKQVRRKHYTKNHTLLAQQCHATNETHAERIKLFSFAELVKATNNFDKSRVIGSGGHGIVYKGLLSDQRVVAIKMSKVTEEDETVEYINEITLLSQINHRNVVMLFGCCLESEVPILVYEFISNGTLSDHIHNRNPDAPFLWTHRLRIVTEIAQALTYLHSSVSMPIFHRDIKSSNILLDDHLTAKVSDFGASKTVQMDQTHITTTIQGTFGYLDPEYLYSGQLTEKSDVYSLGVILVEMLTGQRPYSRIRSDGEKNLVSYFLCLHEKNEWVDIVDDSILEAERREEFQVFANFAAKCLNYSREERPTMKEVKMHLESLQRSVK